MDIADDDKVWVFVNLIKAQEIERCRLPFEKFAAALCALFPTTADVAAVCERLPEALRHREAEDQMASYYYERSRRKEEWEALRPAREAAWEAYRRVAGLDPAEMPERPSDDDLPF